MGKFKDKLTSGLKSFSNGYFQTGGWDGNNLTLWHPDHPLNRSAQWTFSGMSTNREMIENDYLGYVQGAFKANGPVFSCITARQMVFSEAVFKFKSVQDGKLFGNTDLALLENPWPGGTTGDLLSRMEQDVSLTGNSWWTITNDAGQLGREALGGENVRLAHLRSDWVIMIIGSKSGDPRAIDAKCTGIIYRPKSPDSPTGNAPAEDIILPIEDVAHYAPIPDPVARFRGMSWLTPVLRDIEADKSAVKHKGAFFDNAAVPNLMVSFDKETSREDFEEFVDGFKGNHEGSWNAYRTLFLAGGADVTPLTHDFRALDFTNIVGKGEARIASAAGVPPSWVGMSEGMQGSALNTGNMAANRRRFADGTIRPLWRNAVASLAVLINVPTGAILWWDESGIAFLREDQNDLANIVQVQMSAINTGILAGYEPDAVVDAVYAYDVRKLAGNHTGLVSVQMQPPVDPNSDQQQMEVMVTRAKAIQSFTQAGYTHESAVEAVDKDDITKLKKDTAPDAWTPSGQPLAPGGAAPAGAKPPASGKPPAQSGQSGKPASSGGSGNG